MRSTLSLSLPFSALALLSLASAQSTTTFTPTYTIAECGPSSAGLGVANPAASANIIAAVQPTPTPSSTPDPPMFNLAHDYSGSDFFNNWDFFTWPDPTHGQVNFLSRAASEQTGLIYTTESGSSIMRVDDYTWLGDGAQRNSVRVTSKDTFGLGSLVVMDAVRIPYGPSTWPAFWSLGQNWPTGGEIDIIEGTNNQVNNQMTLHTSPGCTLQTPMNATGTVLETNCDANVNSNIGCGVADPSPLSFGSGFNSQGGGVYALYFDGEGIKIWFFLRANIPKDINSGNPSFKGWGPPRASWAASSCDMEKYFGKQTLVFNITMCGDWAGSVYPSLFGGQSCSSAVKNPTNFVNAVWEVNSVKIYSLND